MRGKIPNMGKIEEFQACIWEDNTKTPQKKNARTELQGKQDKKLQMYMNSQSKKRIYTKPSKNGRICLFQELMECKITGGKCLDVYGIQY